MTPAELLAYSRVVVDDIYPPYLASDTLIYAFIQEAIDEVTLRAGLQYDWGATTITLIEDQADYPTDATTLGVRYWWIERVRLVAFERDLIHVTGRQLDQALPFWQSGGSGVPEYYRTDAAPYTLSLAPAPSLWDVDAGMDSVSLRGYYLPAVTASGVEMPVDTIHQRHMSHWVAYKFFQIKDSDTGHGRMALYHAAEFEKYFGTRMSAAQLQRQIRGEDLSMEPRFKLDVAQW